MESYLYIVFVISMNNVELIGLYRIYSALDSFLRAYRVILQPWCVSCDSSFHTHEVTHYFGATKLHR